MELATTLRSACYHVTNSLSVSASRISDKSLHERGDMVLLLGNIDMDMIIIIDRLWSYKMIGYIHIMAHQIIQFHAATMVTVGYYTLISVETNVTNNP